MTIDKNTESEFINNGFVIPYPDDPFEMKSGPFYLSDRNGKTTVSIRVGRSQCNSNLVAHGGLLMTLADLAVCHEAIKGGDYESSVTVSLTANFQKPAPEGALLQAFPKLNHRTKRMAFVDCEILADNTCVFNCSSIIRVMFKNR
tara:strand:- start:97 stop:531 length:435 start_codon:yes stop_codon:yes gene_type:complete